MAHVSWSELWDIHNTQQPSRLWAPGMTKGSKRIATSSDRRILAAGDSKTIWVWDMGTRGLVATLENVSENIFGISVSPDGAIVALSGWSSEQNSYYISVWDVKNQRRLATWPVGRYWIPRLAFSPDGRLLASAGSDGVVRLWGVQ